MLPILLIALVMGVLLDVTLPSLLVEILAGRNLISLAEIWIRTRAFRAALFGGNRWHLLFRHSALLCLTNADKRRKFHNMIAGLSAATRAILARLRLGLPPFVRLADAPAGGIRLSPFSLSRSALLPRR